MLLQFQHKLNSKSTDAKRDTAFPRSLASDRTWGRSDRCLDCKLKNFARIEQPQGPPLVKFSSVCPPCSAHRHNGVEILIRSYLSGHILKSKGFVYKILFLNLYIPTTVEYRRPGVDYF